MRRVLQFVRPTFTNRATAAAVAGRVTGARVIAAAVAGAGVAYVRLIHIRSVQPRVWPPKGSR